jgi:hypothetical protein
MMTAACGADDLGDIGAAMHEIFACAGGLFGKARRGVFAQAAGRRHSAPWERHPGGRRGPGHWGGGFGGPWGGWWAGPPGPPGPPRGPKAGRGDVRAAILALLREGPLNGYQIMSEIEERSGGAWRPSPGAVYPALSQLADEGLIEGSESAGRRTFSLTGAGRPGKCLACSPRQPGWAAESFRSRTRAHLTRCGRLSACWRALGATCTRSWPTMRTTRLPMIRTHEKAGDT